MVRTYAMPIVDVRPATPRSRIVHIGGRDAAFRYKAGQAVMIGRRGQPLRRPYSIASAPEDTKREGTIELLVGVGLSESPGPHLERLEPGIMLDVEGPVGNFVFPDRPNASHFLFIAGGSGIAPLRSMMRHAMVEMPERQVPPAIGLIYSARTRDEFAYLDELERFATDGTIALMLTVTRADESVPWEGTRGRINMTHLRQMVPHRDTMCFLCGPQTLIDDMKPLLRELGLEHEKIRVEEW